ncbi:U3 snoRNP protein, partial [Vermiconidia calcicola]
MAEPVHKRRKVEHVSSDEVEEESGSFESFGDSADEGADIDSGRGNDRFNGDISGQEREEELDDAEDVEADEDVHSDGANSESAEEDGPSMDEDSRTNRPSPGVPNTVPANENEATRNAILKPEPMRSTNTANTFGSNMFKLQVDELLEEIRPRQSKREIEAEEALQRLKKSIETLPSRGPLPIEDAERQLLTSNKVATPFPNPRPPKDAKYKLAYAKPASINVIGSHALKAASRSNKLVEIDMVVTMPSSLFQEKDYLNFRYFYKRAYYIACVAAGLKEAHSTEFDIKFKNFYDNPLEPVLTVNGLSRSLDKSSHGTSSKWQINIIPGISEDVLPRDKLRLERNCIRNHELEPINGTAEGEAQSPTPFYNSSLRSDMLMTSYFKLLHAATKSCDAFKDACLLGSTWLRQRGLDSDMYSGGFGNFEWTALMALLLQGGGPGGRSMLNQGYSSYQLLKATLQLLAVRDLNKQPLVVGADTGFANSTSGDTPVVWDSSRSHNLLYKMTPWSYRALRQEAKTTLSMLGDQHFDGFEATFIVRTDNLLYKYDYIVKLDHASIAGTKPKREHQALEVHRKLYDTLHRGLKDRVTQIHILPLSSDSWSLGSAGPSNANNTELLVGFAVNPDTVNRTIDHGPTAEEKSKSASFRKFWGDKAELRRFKDGSILETLVWSGKEGGQSVFEQIVRHLTTRHFGDEVEKGAHVVGDAYKKMLPQDSGITTFTPLMEAFKQLETDIRSLNGLPLSIRQISPADAQLRYASPTAAARGRRQVPADVVLQFEGSARWPDDLVAIQRTKIAFLIKLQELLQESIDSAVARIGLENQEHDIVNQAFLDIAYDSGAAFRLRIHHDREQTLLERRLKDKALDPRSKEIAAIGLAKYKRDYIKTPAHTQAIARLCSRHPGMSGTIRLTKKWFASHLLSNHIADEIIELMVARTFIQPWPWQTPSSVQTGFLRTLAWLARWDWRAEPLIVDLSGSSELKQAELQSITTKFEAWRKLDPALNRVVLFAASNVDTDGTTWSDGRPAKVVAGRMSALTKAACTEASEKQLSLDPASLFASPLGDFDFVLHLDSELVGKSSQRKRSSKNGVVFKNLELADEEESSSVGFDPFGELVSDLERLYGSAILFFSGHPERPIIAGLWSPQT